MWMMCLLGEPFFSNLPIILLSALPVFLRPFFQLGCQLYACGDELSTDQPIYSIFMELP